MAPPRPDRGVRVTSEGDVVLPAALVARLRWAVAGAALVVAGLVACVALLLPRALALPPLVEENLALRQRLQEVDARLAEVDRLLLRLRGYDAQLRSLTDVPTGDHGPLPADVDAADVAAWRASAVTRAEHAAVRAGRAAADLAVVEPEIAALAAELEDDRALQAALPQMWPADGLLSSPFGYRRSPFGWTRTFHSGLDIAGDRGDPVVAASAGVVLRSEWHSGYGRMVEIDHGFGITTLYGHNRRVVVDEGDRVEEGELIAIMGATGRATGPHLHFELLFDGHPVDPLPYLPPR